MLSHTEHVSKHRKLNQTQNKFAETFYAIRQNNKKFATRADKKCNKTHNF